ncbi:hypothetical protein ABPG72_001291 [Tetrahymena utriculariae]
MSGINPLIQDVSSIDPRAEPGYILSQEYPQEQDYQESSYIKQMIDKYFYHPEKEKLKEQIIMKIQEIVNQWMVNININERKIPEQVAHMQLARVLPFGSYFLGVSSVDGDVDLVCIAPNFVDRFKHFNGQLYDMISNMEGVEYHNNVIDAKVPIMQFEIQGVPIDISFAQLDVETLPDDIDKQIPDTHLTMMDERDKLSINGYRCNQAIIRYVTEHSEDKQQSKQRFQESLKVIKIWARNNGIYENRLGYLGGISWALLLAKICQMFPNLEVNGIIEQFFLQYSSWKWPTMEVLLGPFSQPEERQKNQKFEMSIYTPAYPEYNSTERVKKINLEIIDYKIKEANRIIQEEIKTGLASWDKLIQEEDFLNKYAKFIEIDLIRIERDETMREFKTQQDKLSVKLLTLFEFFSQKKPLELEIRPWPFFYKKKDLKYPQCSAFLIGIKAKSHIQEEYSFKNCIQEFAIQQRKSLDALTNCMIRVFQAAKQDLNDIAFSEEDEKQFQNQNDSQENEGYQNLNQKRQNDNSHDYEKQLPYKKLKNYQDNDESQNDQQNQNNENEDYNNQEQEYDQEQQDYQENNNGDANDQENNDNMDDFL